MRPRAIAPYIGKVSKVSTYKLAPQTSVFHLYAFAFTCFPLSGRWGLCRCYWAVIWHHM